MESFHKESRRDSIFQPRVVESARLPWVSFGKFLSTQKGLNLLPSLNATLSGLMKICNVTQGSPLRVQPWAERYNPVGIVGWRVRFGSFLFASQNCNETHRQEANPKLWVRLDACCRGPKLEGDTGEPC